MILKENRFNNQNYIIAYVLERLGSVIEAVQIRIHEFEVIIVYININLKIKYCNFSTKLINIVKIYNMNLIYSRNWVKIIHLCPVYLAKANKLSPMDMKQKRLGSMKIQ